MGNCSICGQPAGWFRKIHTDCETRYRAGLDELISVATSAVLNPPQCDTLMERSRAIAQPNRISDANIRDAMVVGWERALDRFLDDGILSQEEENQLMAYAAKFGLGQMELNR